MFNNINTKSVTFNLIIINVLVYLLCMIYPQLNSYLSMHYIFNTHHYSQDAGFIPIQIISHMFMHAGLLHIAFNMWGLFMFGNILEHVWGPRRFLTFYMITGFGAVILHSLVQMFLVYHATGSVDPSAESLEAHREIWATYLTPVVGASGAIFGLLTAFAMLFPNTELITLYFPVPVKAKYLIPIFIVIELFFGGAAMSGDDVAHFAHLGGALFGFIIVKLWNRNRNSLY